MDFIIKVFNTKILTTNIECVGSDEHKEIWEVTGFLNGNINNATFICVKYVFAIDDVFDEDSLDYKNFEDIIFCENKIESIKFISAFKSERDSSNRSIGLGMRFAS